MKQKPVGKGVAKTDKRNYNIAAAFLKGQRYDYEAPVEDMPFDLLDIKMNEEQYQHYDAFTKHQR